MKRSFYIFVVVSSMAIVNMFFCSCSDNVPSPYYIGEIVMDDDAEVLDWGLSGQTTPDGNYLYHGSVILYSADGSSCEFPCFQGKKGMDKGCRGVVHYGVFYNLDRNKWVTIGGVKYKASNILD